MKRALIVFFMLVFVMVGAVSGAVAYGGFHHKRSCGILNSLTKLDLTDAQKKSIATILKSNKAQSQTLRANLKTAKQNLRTAMSTPNATEAAIRAAYKPVAAAVEEMIVNRAQVKAQIAKVLTPEQQAQLDKHKQDRLAKKKDHPKTGKSLTDEWIDKYSK
ncbi:MAG: Spy/CpxP family protein refolding chaperone [Deltaproteobacteria bacterium]|nr:Spy/CpxP family protein refolding chaperone [Deltaproteobacteria bacterium]MBF0525779.1 Spy/CpxP family protein refolding chaperone [Deltaproteobacteria bacterium]